MFVQIERSLVSYNDYYNVIQANTFHKYIICRIFIHMLHLYIKIKVPGPWHGLRALKIGAEFPCLVRVGIASI